MKEHCVAKKDMANKLNKKLRTLLSSGACCCVNVIMVFQVFDNTIVHQAESHRHVCQDVIFIKHNHSNLAPHHHPSETIKLPPLSSGFSSPQCCPVLIIV